jgi:predicted RNase H-like HicB family nuclease/predicted RNA binding protein YcfA (HicA-like mRNA interferase family)
MKVRDTIKLIEQDGWRLVRTRGSHRQYRHAVKTGLVTVPGKLSNELAPGYARQRAEASRTEAMKYLIVIEKTGTGYSAYSPDLPGCVSTGATLEEVERNMHEAIDFHLDGLRKEGFPIPQPSSASAYVDVSA